MTSGLATTAADVEKAASRLPQLLKEGEEAIGHALANAALPANRERLGLVRADYVAYIDILTKIAQTQRDRIGLWSRQIDIAGAWDKGVEELLQAGALSAKSRRSKRQLLLADEEVKLARSATWRAQVTHDESLNAVVASNLGKVSTGLKAARQHHHRCCTRRQNRRSLLPGDPAPRCRPP